MSPSLRYQYRRSTVRGETLTDRASHRPVVVVLLPPSTKTGGAVDTRAQSRTAEGSRACESARRDGKLCSTG